MLIDCRKNLSQSDCTDCKITTIEGKKKKLFLVSCLDRCQCFEIQKKLAFFGEWPTICRSVIMGRLYSQDSKSHKKQMPS
jgi:hypothetical protein